MLWFLLSYVLGKSTSNGLTAFSSIKTTQWFYKFV